MSENDFSARLRAMSDSELIDALNGDVGKPGWVAARGRFHTALREEFIRRGIELFDLVDEKDKVVGITNRTTAHATKQPHRVAAVYVFNSKGELYVQVHKKSGGRYDHSVGGHVSKGENYAAAAAREADEELGIKQPLKYLTTFYSSEGSYRHMFGLFECTADDSWKFVPNEEVGEIIPMKLAVIERMMKDNPEKFTSGFINSMKHYRKIKNLSLL